MIAMFPVKRTLTVAVGVVAVGGCVLRGRAHRADT